MPRPAAVASSLRVVLLLAGCAGGEETADEVPAEATESSSSESPSETPAEETPSESPADESTGPVDSFDTAALCPDDRALAEKMTGTPLTTDKQVKPGERLNGFVRQADTCLLEGPKGRIETLLITESSLVDRQKSLDYATIAPCQPAPLNGGWDKAWACDPPDGHGPILLRFGTDSVLVCGTASQGPKPAAATKGREMCDAILSAAAS